MPVMLKQVAVPRFAFPASSAVIELLKPITWFPPMWAFACGLVSGGIAVPRELGLFAAGLVLAGPLLCGASQAVNDWFDRDVDAVNEPSRPIPSGRIGGSWGLVLAIGCTGLSLVAAAAFGRWVFIPALLGTALSWCYSAPPFRLKLNGWLGNAAVALSYEGLAWLAGAAVVAAAPPDGRTILIALLYSLAAHGIMTLNDFKSVEGDRRFGVRSLPVRLGIRTAARVACLTMLVPQVAVLGALVSWHRPLHALILALLVSGQTMLMPALLHAPRDRAARYNATGTTLLVLGMMVSALALRSLSGGTP